MLRSIDGIVIERNVYQVFVHYWPNAFENPVDTSNPIRHIEAVRLLDDLPK
ncbi:MAG: hypothetical protein JJU13_16415 [Balneolaceae bacterium]|nr:hypothetical protein [Balneolaceae bacterium]